MIHYVTNKLVSDQKIKFRAHIVFHYNRLDCENTIKEGKRGIQWTLTEKLEELDFADDIVLLSKDNLTCKESY